MGLMIIHTNLMKYMKETLRLNKLSIEQLIIDNTIVYVTNIE